MVIEYSIHTLEKHRYRKSEHDIDGK